MHDATSVGHEYQHDRCVQYRKSDDNCSVVMRDVQNPHQAEHIASNTVVRQVQIEIGRKSSACFSAHCPTQACSISDKNYVEHSLIQVFPGLRSRWEMPPISSRGFTDLGRKSTQQHAGQNASPKTDARNKAEMAQGNYLFL